MIRFKDLSMPLKTLAVLGWVVVGLETLAFLVGFVIGVLSY